MTSGLGTTVRRELEDGGGRGRTPSGRTFWVAFTGGWMVYGGLFVLAALMEGASLPEALAGGGGTVGPYALLAVWIALERRRLLRPEWGLLRSLAVHGAVALLYSLAGASLSALLLTWLGPLVPETLEPAGGLVWFFKVVSGFFLYALLAGILMWTESVRRVVESRRIAAREAVLRARAEAKALRAQFNPHFVFNTLHSLMLLVREDPGAAERAIEDVAELIRYASVVQRDEVDAVPLAREIEVAGRYLALEKLRLGGRLEVEWRVTEPARRSAVPPFSLQTLLENAIKHGLAPRTEGGTVRIEADLSGNELVVTVEDDGEGADPEGVRRAAGRGLDLVRQRLESLHGDDARLSWRTAPGEGFRATLTLPAEAGSRASGAKTRAAQPTSGVSA